MSSMWNSKRAILKDLSLAQGCEVPTDLESTITAGEKPPALNIVEEDEYFQHCFGDYQQTDGSATPDCGLILQMLELVQSKDDISENKVAEQSLYVKEDIQEKTSIESNNVKESKRNSILLNSEPSSMFRKKRSSVSKNTSNDRKSTSPPKNVTSITTYQPSTLADEYCQQFMERSKLRDSIKEDVWCRAIKIMNDIDTKKKLDAENLAAIGAIDTSEVKQQTSQKSTDPAGSSTESSSSYAVVLLPQHRHLLTGECIVCEVFKKHGIDIDFDLKSDNFDLNSQLVASITL